MNKIETFSKINRFTNLSHKRERFIKSNHLDIIMVNSVNRVWKTGNNNLVLTIPKKIRQVKNYQKGDLVDINWEEIKVLREHSSLVPSKSKDFEVLPVEIKQEIKIEKKDLPIL